MEVILSLKVQKAADGWCTWFEALMRTVLSLVRSLWTEGAWGTQAGSSLKEAAISMRLE